MKRIIAVTMIVFALCTTVQATENWWTGTVNTTWQVQPNGAQQTDSRDREFRYLDACMAWVGRAMTVGNYAPTQVPVCWSGWCVKDIGGGSQAFWVVDPYCTNALFGATANSKPIWRKYTVKTGE